jgi:peroxiredoxin
MAAKARSWRNLKTKNSMPDTQQSSRLNKGMEILLWFVALAVLAENIILFLQNRRLNEALAPQITAGTQLQALAGIAFDGRLKPVALPAAGSKLLVITFSPGCPACQANQDGWMKLQSVLEQKGVRVLWVSRDPVEITRDYCVKRGIPLFDTLADPPYRTFVQLGLARVPNTLLVGADGRVEKVWAGRLDQAGWDTIFAYFGEREGMAFPLRSQVGANSTGCGSELSQASAKSCK